MKKAFLIAIVLCVAVISTACINNIAVQELNNKAAEFMQKGQYEEAMNRLQASLDLDSTMYETYYNLGIAAISAKKYEKAIEALENGIKIKPDYADFYYSLGVAQISLADEIIEDLEAVELKNKDKNKDEDDLEETSDKVKKTKEDAVELKRLAIENLTKYLEKNPNADDRESIEEMIKQSDEFVNGKEQTSKGE